MGIFQDVHLGWKGDEFTIPAARVLGAIAIVEEQLTFPELIAAMQTGKPPLVLIARAYGGVLRYAGCKVTDEETYAGMFDTAAQEQIVASINTLLVMMVPPGSLAHHAPPLANGNGAAAPGNSKAAASKSSKRSTKRPSAAAG